ncbi:dihydropteroate synthase [Gilvimarinus agarilyticus]|uniref:dihydropteroate synthase n=1 Tax=Gilvimarinus agarilyticus TaxID=679259 RepID=UPI0005A0E861|nr:dihydropteroate synthase [Gilvimarinus agarilyticus]
MPHSSFVPAAVNCANHELDFSRPLVMGILNATPDSFSDGGSYYQGASLDIALVLQRARQMLVEGANIIDVGGESTRPGATPVTQTEELDRVVPVIEAITKELGALVSVDTSCPVVMREAESAGAGLINDVRALRRDGALQAAAQTGLPVCLMHMRGEPGTMTRQQTYPDVLTEVHEFFAQRLQACAEVGIAPGNIMLDPGFGFGKSLEQNLTLLRHLAEFQRYRLPLLVGLSRKSLLGKLLGREVSERLPGSLALAHESVLRGANIVRVHDVAATADMINVHLALQSGRGEKETKQQ